MTNPETESDIPADPPVTIEDAEAEGIDAEDGPHETFPGAPDSLVAMWMHRRGPLRLSARDYFPPADLDLKACLAARIPADLPALEEPQTLHAKKLHGMRVELSGRSELAAVNAILIAHLRKARHPNHAPALFRRIWTEAGDALLEELPSRWLISSAITFGDHGETEAQRRIGLSLNILFSLMKIYEFERFHSSYDAARPFPIWRARKGRLPLDIPHFKLISGGLDVNLLAPIWAEARKEPVCGPLACHLLQRLNEDPGNLFRRIWKMRAERRLARMKRVMRGQSPDLAADDDEALANPDEPPSG